MEIVGVLRGTWHKLVKGRWFQKARTVSKKGKTISESEGVFDTAGPVFVAVSRVREREIRKNTKAMWKDKLDVCQKEENI